MHRHTLRYKYIMAVYAQLSFALIYQILSFTYIKHFIIIIFLLQCFTCFQREIHRQKDNNSICSYLRCLWLQCFLRSQFHACLWSSTSNVLIFCVFISLPAFFTCGLWQFYYQVYRHGFLWVYSGFNELLRSVIRLFSSNWDFNHVLSYIYSVSFFSPVFLGDLICRCSTVWYYPMDHWTDHFSFYLSFGVLFRLVNFNPTVLKFSDPFLLFAIWHQAFAKVNFISDIFIFHSRLQFASFCTFFHLRFPMSSPIEAIFFFKIFIVPFLLYIFICIYFNICIYLL